MLRHCQKLSIALVLAAAPVFAADAPGSEASVTYSKDVAPILYKNCVGCHRPNDIAPMSLLTYKDARPWAASIGDFLVSNTCGASILANRSCTVTVRFAPIATGIRTAILTISTDDLAGQRSINLTSGVNPVLTVTPAGPLSFSSNLNTSASVQPVTISNTGN